MSKLEYVKQKGMVSGLMAVAILLLAISLPVTVLLVQKNQENRSNAASETEDYDLLDEEDNLTDISGECGTADGKAYAFRPTADLCSVGEVIWNDSSANGGYYSWSCAVGDEVSSDMTVDCSAEKLLKDEGGSIDGRCGEANGEVYSSKPISNYVLCKSGDLNWTDEVGLDGEINWSCEGLSGGQSVVCSSTISN